MDSNMTDNKQFPLDLSHHFGRVAAARKESSIKSLYKYFAIPGIAQLAGGLPNAHYFPFDTLEGAVATPTRWEPRKEDTSDSSSHVTVPHDVPPTDPKLRIDLASALQYGTAQGYPALYNWVKEFTTKNLHPNVPYKDGADVILTVGSTDGFQKVLQTLSNEWYEGLPVSHRQGMLVEEFCYTGPVGAARPRGLNIVPVGMDGQGMIPEKLEAVLSGWDDSQGKRPHLLYTVSIGQNPTGGTTSLERRRKLYSICQHYDVIIVEDDPYWYLQYDLSPGKKENQREQPHSSASSGYDFLDSLVPSYISVDTDGRVVRLDTFSKTVAPGCRLGWVTAQPAIIERIWRYTETSTQQPSGFVQSLISELILGPNGWGTAGFVRWLEGLRAEYERRAKMMCDIFDKGRTTVVGTAAEDDWQVVRTVETFSFIRPEGGMFLWLHVHFENHPLYQKYPTDLIARACWVHLTKKKFRVLVSPGSVFAPTPEIAQRGWQYFRVCFAAVNTEIIETASHGFVEGLRSFWKVKSVHDIEAMARLAPTAESLSV